MSDDVETPVDRAWRSRMRLLTRAETVTRARLLTTEAGREIGYSMRPGQAGGRDPFAGHPGARWKRLGFSRITCDCTAFVAWALGFDRYQPGFVEGWDWINTDSMIIEARTKGHWFKILMRPRVGCLVVYPSIDYNGDGDRDRVGHVGMVVAVPSPDGPNYDLDALALWPADAPPFSALRVAHASAGNARRAGRAILETDGRAWAGAETWRARREQRWGAVFLDYQRLV